MMKTILVGLILFLTACTFPAVTPEKKTWADYGHPPGVITKDDFRPANEVNEPRFNMAAPNFWAQFETKK
jgi:hypothetical protein